MSLMRAVSAFGSIALACSLCACSQQQQDEKIAVVVQQPTSGFNVASGVMYPLNFPVPQYPGSKITTSSATGTINSGPSTRALVLTSGDDIYKIADFYQRQLTSEGWQLTRVTSVSNLCNMDLTKGSLKASISIAPAGGNFSIAGQETAATSIQIVVLPNSKRR